MSISADEAQKFKDEVAVVCCRTEAGTIISADNLEDPNIFPDLVDSGLLSIPENAAKIGQVIGAKLLKTIDSLTPITPEIIEGMKVEGTVDTNIEKLIDSDKKAVLKFNMKAGDVIKAADLENQLILTN